MSITKRFIGIELLGFLLLIPAALVGFATVFFVAYNVVCVALLIADYVLTPKKSAFAVSRKGGDVLYFKAENTLEISFRNLFHRPISVEIKDQVPDLHFKINAAHLKQTVDANSECVFSYELTPTKRGVFLFPGVYVKYTGLLGFCTKSFYTALPTEYKVYPNVKDLSKFRLMLKKFRSDGAKRIPLRGAGVEFESLRAYVDGDDFRNINWMATARENKLLVNQYEVEKDQPVMILLDAGRPMSYLVNGYKKLDYAINAALVLSDIVMQNGDKSGLLVFDADVKSYVPPGKGELQRNLLMETLYHITDTKYTSDYQSALLHINNHQSRHSTVFVFTDFQTLDEAAEMITGLGILAKKHSPIVVFMKNEQIKKAAETAATDLKTAYEKGVAIDLLNEREKIIRALRVHNIPCVESDAENFATAAVNRYVGRV